MRIKAKMCLRYLVLIRLDNFWSKSKKRHFLGNNNELDTAVRNYFIFVQKVNAFVIRDAHVL